MRKLVLVCLIILMFFPFYSQSNGKGESLTYWEAVYHNGISMTDDEYFKNCTTVSPIEIEIRFEVTMEIDGVHYGNFFISNYPKDGMGVLDKNRVVSEKKINDGLYDNICPMIKTETGRNDIKYLWHPAAIYAECVFFKFSFDNYTSEWISLYGIPENKEVKKLTSSLFTSKIQTSLKNPDNLNSLKVEGIRIIYNCDYDLVKNNLHEAYNFVNDDTEHSPKFVETNAKYIELKDSVFDKVCYHWRFANDVYSSGNAPRYRSKIIITSYDKVNFEDIYGNNLQAENKIKENYRILKEKLDDKNITPNDMLNDKPRSFYEALLKEVENSDTGPYKEELIEQAKKMLEDFDFVERLKKNPKMKAKLKQKQL